MQKIKLFCLPFAGGSRYSYRQYMQLAPEEIEVIPLEIPGRGTRTNEPALTKIEAIAEDVLQQIKDQIHTPYALYGHSMGGLIGYLVTQKIIALGLPQPQHLFFTSCTGPSMRFRDQVDHKLPKTEFIEKIKALGGSSDEVLKDPVLMDFFEPILRADFEAVASFAYQTTVPFSIPITVIIGKEERITLEEAGAWQKETNMPIEVSDMPGNHFFILGQEAIIIEKIQQQLFKNTVAS